MTWLINPNVGKYATKSVVVKASLEELEETLDKFLKLHPRGVTIEVLPYSLNHETINTWYLRLIKDTGEDTLYNSLRNIHVTMDINNRYLVPGLHVFKGFDIDTVYQSLSKHGYTITRRYPGAPGTLVLEVKRAQVIDALVILYTDH
jgi:hypothetical protein